MDTELTLKRNTDSGLWVDGTTGTAYLLLSEVRGDYWVDTENTQWVLESEMEDAVDNARDDGRAEAWLEAEDAIGEAKSEVDKRLGLFEGLIPAIPPDILRQIRQDDPRLHNQLSEHFPWL